MKPSTVVLPAFFALHASAAPTYYQPPLLNTTISINSTSSDFNPLPPSSCLVKLEGTLKDLTTSTLSILLGSSTTMLGYAFCGITMPAETWETCTDYAVIAGSVVGLSHLAMWKFPEVLNDLNMYDTTVRPWEQQSAAWSMDEGPNGKVEVKARVELPNANLGAWP